MIVIGIIQLILTVSILLLTRLVDLRKDNRLTKAGRALVMLACLSLFFGIGQLALSSYQSKLSKFQFSTGDIQIDLYCRYWTYEIDDVVLSHSPEALLINYVYIGDYATRFDLSRVPAVRRPSGYRSLPVSTLVYHSHNLRKDIIEQDRKSPFKYLWDVNGKTIRFAIPTHKFKGLDNNHKWQFSIEVRVADIVIYKELDEGGKVEIQLEGLSKEELLEH